MHNRDLEKGVTCYEIKVGEKKDQVIFHQTKFQDLYGPHKPGCFTRKAISSNLQQPKKTERFVDKEFKLKHSEQYKVVRLFDLIKEQTLLFPVNDINSSYIPKLDHYNSFHGESGLLSYEYTRTLFITQFVNEEGYYRYFVKRNSQQYVEQCDDYILVDRKTLKPIWNLDISHPWQIILFKAWLKECGSLNQMNKKKPFSFLNAFGLPIYQEYNFRKQIKFLVDESVTEDKKRKNLKDFTLFKKEVQIIGKSVDSPAANKIGISANNVGYKFNLAEENANRKVFNMKSTLPCSWVGYNTAIHESPLNQTFQNTNNIDLERNFLVSQKEILTFFDRFYVSPSVANQPGWLILQDCMTLQSKAGVANWIKIPILESGMLGLSIQICQQLKDQKFYPEFRYFLSKKISNNKQILKSQLRQELTNSKLEQNMYISSQCNKWNNFNIDFMQGYSNKSGFYTKVEAGEFVLFIQAEYTGKIKVRFESYVKMQEPFVFQPDVKMVKQIFDSTFFQISGQCGVEATFNQALYQESISLNNSFSELGFGSICIKTLPKAKHKVAMRIFPEKLKEAGLELMPYYLDLIEQGKKEKNIVMISDKGVPKIIVLQRINNRSKSEIGQIFPPPGSVEFFKVTPNRVVVVPPK